MSTNKSKRTAAAELIEAAAPRAANYFALLDNRDVTFEWDILVAEGTVCLVVGLRVDPSGHVHISWPASNVTPGDALATLLIMNEIAALAFAVECLLA